MPKKTKPVRKRSKAAAVSKNKATNKASIKRAAKKPAAKNKTTKPRHGAAARIRANILIPEPIKPVSRGERYEDPLFDALQRAGMGGEGDGGGSLCSSEGEIEEVDFDVELASPDAVPIIIRVLEDRGAPKGSVVRYAYKGKDVEVSFGVTECVAIYLDGVSQAPEVYSSTSAQELLDSLMAATEGSAEYRGSWRGPRETSLYLYGLDAEAMFAKLEPILRAYPLSRNARVIVRHGSQALRPREVKLRSTPS